MGPRILRQKDAALYLGLRESTIEKMRVSGSGPRFVKLGSRAIGYALEDLDLWIEERKRSSTSDPGVASTRLAALKRRQRT
jgi:predicted DNA-binding transcriptional regulator AlpA